MEFEWRLIDQLDQAFGGAPSECQFGRAFGLADLRRIDIRDTDFLASDPQRVSVNDTGRAAATFTLAEVRPRYFRWGKRSGPGRSSREHRDKHRRDSYGNNGHCDAKPASAQGDFLATLRCHAARFTTLEITTGYHRSGSNALLTEIGLVE